jgi:ribosome-binding factor A
MSARTDKVASIVLHRVAAELQRLAPDVGVACTITSVDVSPDMKHALLWVGVIGDEALCTTMLTRLDGLSGQLQRAVAEAMSTKYSPRLAFRYDASGQYAQHMGEVMRGL